MSSEGRRLPNELLCEMAGTMPAGIIDLEGFMMRMQPLSAFIRPIMCKFQSKIKQSIHHLELQRETLNLKFDELKFDQRFDAFEQQIEELKKQNEAFEAQVDAYDSAWKRSVDFVKELTGKAKADNNKNGQAISSSGGDGTVCETGKKRKKPTGSGEEEKSAEEEMKKAKTD